MVSLCFHRVSRMARYDGRHPIDVIHEIVGSGEVEVDRLDGQNDATAASDPDPEGKTRPTVRTSVSSTTRAKLRRLLRTFDDLASQTWREGPFTLLEEYVTRTGIITDLLAIDSLQAKRTIANIGSFMRFARDWQQQHSRGSLADFVDYLDAYQAAAGELPTSVEATEDSNGVQLMTLYQAKGLEFDNVFVPRLLKDEWPAREFGSGLFPAELLKEAVPSGDPHTDEERRLLYVALTRAKERLFISTAGGSGADGEPSPFIADVVDGSGSELAMPIALVVAGGDSPIQPDVIDTVIADLHLEPRRIPTPTARERRLALRVRANEYLELLEGINTADPEATEARAQLAQQFSALALRAVDDADQARAHDLDPLTLRVVALDSEAGASLLDVAPLPSTFSYSQMSTYERCPLQYALQKIYGIPSGRKAGALTFGSTAHDAFEAFTRDRRERLARGEPVPTREDLQRHFEAAWKPGEFEGKTTEQHFQGRSTALLDSFWEGELESIGTAEAEELPFELSIDIPDGPAAIFTGSVDRIDRLPSGGIEVIDYKTGRVSSQKGVHESLQLSIYALACRDALGLGTPEKVTLYFTEARTRMSTTRSDEQLDRAREEMVTWVQRLRAGDFAATPGRDACQ